MSDDWKVNPSRPGLVLYRPDVEERPPNKYNPEIHRDIVELLKRGHTPDKVAPFTGIATATFWKWVHAGRAGNPHLAEFAQDVDAAMAQGLMQIEAAVLTEAQKDGNLGFKVLTARDNKNYNREIKIKVESEISTLLDRLASDPRLPAKYFDIVLEIASEQTSAGALEGPEEGEADSGSE